MACHVIVPAAGSGSRFGSATPKQYLALGDRPVLAHTIACLVAGFPNAAIHVVLAPEDRWFDALVHVSSVDVLRCGGATRAETVRNALQSLSGVSSEDWIAVHDAVRPCLEPRAAARLQQELADHRVGGLLAIPVADTLKRVDDTLHITATESRERLWRAQTPQMFRLHVLAAALSRSGAEDATDEAEAVERSGRRPHVVMGSADNIKITFPEDLELARAILAARDAQ